jgi:hypothetical protein
VNSRDFRWRSILLDSETIIPTVETRQSSRFSVSTSFQLTPGFKQSHRLEQSDISLMTVSLIDSVIFDNTNEFSLRTVTHGQTHMIDSSRHTQSRSFDGSMVDQSAKLGLSGDLLGSFSLRHSVDNVISPDFPDSLCGMSELIRDSSFMAESTIEIKSEHFVTTARFSESQHLIESVLHFNSHSGDKSVDVYCSGEFGLSEFVKSRLFDDSSILTESSSAGPSAFHDSIVGIRSMSFALTVDLCESNHIVHSVSNLNSQNIIESADIDNSKELHLSELVASELFVDSLTFESIVIGRNSISFFMTVELPQSNHFDQSISDKNSWNILESVDVDNSRELHFSKFLTSESFQKSTGFEGSCITRKVTHFIISEAFRSSNAYDPTVILPNISTPSDYFADSVILAYSHDLVQSFVFSQSPNVQHSSNISQSPLAPDSDKFANSHKFYTSIAGLNSFMFGNSYCQEESFTGRDSPKFERSSDLAESMASLKSNNYQISHSMGVSMVLLVSARIELSCIAPPSMRELESNRYQVSYDLGKSNLLLVSVTIEYSHKTPPSIPEMESDKFTNSHYHALSIGFFISRELYRSKHFQQSLRMLNSLEYEASLDLVSSLRLSGSQDFEDSIMRDQSLICLPSDLRYMPSIDYDHISQQFNSLVFKHSVTFLVTNDFHSSIGRFADSLSLISLFVLTTDAWRFSNRIGITFLPKSRILDGSYHSSISETSNSSTVCNDSFHFNFSMSVNILGSARVHSPASEKFLHRFITSVRFDNSHIHLDSVQFKSATLHSLTISQLGLSGGTNVSTVGLAGIGLAILAVLVIIIASLCFLVAKHRREQGKDEAEEDMDVDVDSESDRCLWTDRSDGALHGFLTNSFETLSNLSDLGPNWDEPFHDLHLIGFEETNFDIAI